MCFFLLITMRKASNETHKDLKFLYCLHRELGGALCAVWSSYIASETKLIFVVDSSDIASIALVGVQFVKHANRQS